MSADEPRGLFVTFEGIEGSGKTTQIRRLVRRLKSAGIDVVPTREPGGTPLGRRLRAALLDSASSALAPRAELLLYAADRAQHLFEVVEPALARGAVVLCDRFLDATIAYQGHGRGLGADAVLELHRRPPLDRRPDRTILLDVDPDAGLTRARSRNDGLGLSTTEGRFEAEPLEFHRRVRAAYLALAAAEPGRFRVVASDTDPDEVERRVAAAVADLVRTDPEGS